MTALVDPATQPGARRTVHAVSDPCSADLLAGVTAVVTVELGLRSGQEFPDMYVSARPGYTWAGAQAAASAAAGKLAATTGHVFRVSRTQRVTSGGRLVDASCAP